MTQTKYWARNIMIGSILLLGIMNFNFIEPLISFLTTIVFANGNATLITIATVCGTFLFFKK
jgi:hypothetical protein